MSNQSSNATHSQEEPDKLAQQNLQYYVCGKVLWNDFNSHEQHD